MKPKPKRSLIVGVRLTREEYEAVEREARRHGSTMAQAIRLRALRGLRIDEPAELETQGKAVGQ